METTQTQPTLRFNRFLPYWAVLQTDLRQTLRSWVFRLWVLLCFAAAAGYGLYKVGVHREAGIVQAASVQTGDLLRGVAIASLALIALLAVSAISGERSTVADSILSRGISRHQYFLAKWHSRSLTVLATFAAIAGIVLTCYHYLLDSDLTLNGSLAAIAVGTAVLAAVVAWGVTVGALANGTIIGITIFWMVLYGLILLCSFLPDPFPSPTVVISQMRSLLRGTFDETRVLRVILVFLLLALVGAGVGMFGFGRKDV